MVTSTALAQVTRHVNVEYWAFFSKCVIIDSMSISQLLDFLATEQMNCK